MIGLEKMKKSAENCGAEFKTAEVKSVDFKGDFKKINLINEMVKTNKNTRGHRSTQDQIKIVEIILKIFRRKNIFLE
mgnify:CR=1 FL=1